MPRLRKPILHAVRFTVAVVFLLLGLGRLQAGFLLVSDNSLNSVLRYDATTGAFIDQFVPGSNTGLGRGGLESPLGLVFGPDGNLYVSSGGTGTILEYNGESGAFIHTFATIPGGGVARGLTFGPDGNLYVSDSANRIDRFNGRTGAFLGVFASGGGLDRPEGLAFGPDGRLYVASSTTSSVNEYDGTSGAYLGDITLPGRPNPRDLTFGPGGNLYVVTDGTGAGGVMVYSGTTGQFKSLIPGQGSPEAPFGLAFGPDGNLYVSQLTGNGMVDRFNAQTGAFLDHFVVSGPAESSSWLVAPTYLAFSPEITPVPAPPGLVLLTVGALCLLGSMRRNMNGGAQAPAPAPP